MVATLFIRLERARRARVLLPGFKEEVESANSEAVRLMMDSEPTLVDVGAAREKISGMRKTLLHAGPPLTWERMSGPMRGAVIGSIIYEGWARKTAEAQAMVEAGEVELDCNNHRNAVGPMAGVISPSMPVYEVSDTGRRSTFSNFNEGIGKVLRFGAFGPEVIERLRWIEKVHRPDNERSAARPAKERGAGSITQAHDSPSAHDG